MIVRSPWRRFAVFFLAALAICGGFILPFGRLPEAIGCRSSSDSDSFVADCQRIGDYEHAAFAFGLEPAALRRLAAADVVTLGNSRSQFVFSTEAVRRFFESRNIPTYRLGFGHGEGSPFALHIMRKAGGRPRLALINADPFFTAELSRPAAYLVSEPWRAWLGALRIKFALGTRDRFCAIVEWKTVCRGWRSTMYRVRADGRWSWRNTFSVREGATEIDAAPAPPLDLPPETVTHARTFLDATGIAPRCLVLTAVPNSKQDAGGAAAELARALGAPLIMPQLNGLRTIDGSHLDTESAERWSSAFLRQLEPILPACLGTGEEH